VANRPAVLALGIGLASLGCLQSRFHPTLPMRARSGELQLDLQEVRVGAGTTFVYRSQSQVSSRIRRVWLTTPSRIPCTGGHEMAWLSVDGTQGAPLGPGTHEVQARFYNAPNDVADIGLDLVVDLRFEEGGCARAPALSHSVPLSTPNRFLLVASYGVDGGGELRGLRAVHGGRVGGGGWLGRFLITAEVGVGGTFCAESVCGKDDDGSLRSRVIFPLALDARYALAPRIFNALSHGWLLGARYLYLPVRVPALDGQRRFGVHGLHLMPGWAYGLVASGNGPYLNFHRTPLFEIALPVGVVLDPDNPTRRVGLSLGLSMRALLPL
jgi:hypothetical protein